MGNFSEEAMTAAVIEKVFLNETKEPTELEKLIADSIAARDAKIAEAERKAEAEEARYAALFQSIVDRTIELVREIVPAPLGPYLRYTGGLPVDRAGLDAGTWRPDWLHVQAPGLAEIALGLGWNGDGLWIGSIAVQGFGFKPSHMQEAICAAHDHYHNQRAEYSKAARGLDY